MLNMRVWKNKRKLTAEIISEVVALGKKIVHSIILLLAKITLMDIVLMAINAIFFILNLIFYVKNLYQVIVIIQENVEKSIYQYVDNSIGKNVVSEMIANFIIHQLEFVRKIKRLIVWIKTASFIMLAFKKFHDLNAIYVVWISFLKIVLKLIILYLKMLSVMIMVYFIKNLMIVIYIGKL